MIKLSLKENEQFQIAPYHQRTSGEHFHDYLELVYVLKGKAYHNLNGEGHFIKENDYFIIDYNNSHGYTTIDSDEIEIINCLFTPAFIDRSLKDCKSFSEVISNYQIKFRYKALSQNPTSCIFHDNGEVLNIIKKLLKEYREKEKGYYELIRCLVTQIIIISMRQLSPADSSDFEEGVTADITDYVDKNYYKKISLSDFAERHNYSTAHLSRKFKTDIGVSFMEYLQRTRIEQCCRLLCDTDKNINDIAESVGYTDIKYFNEVFKKHLNITPYKYRKLNK